MGKKRATVNVKKTFSGDYILLADTQVIISEVREMSSYIHLRDLHGRHDGFVVERPSSLVLIWKDF